MIEPDERQRILATIPRGDAQLPLLLHRAPGSEPRDLVVYLHGMAEDKVDPDSPMPRIFTDLGMDVLRFNYAGLHGIPGVHTLSSGLDDVQAILDALDAGTIDTDLKPARTVLVGYSFGSVVALLSAAADPRVDAVAALAIGDHGRIGRILADPGSAVAQQFRDAVTVQIANSQVTVVVSIIRLPGRAQREGAVSVVVVYHEVLPGNIIAIGNHQVLPSVAVNIGNP